MARKEKQYHFIYKTTNVLTSRYYYGMHSTDNLNDNYLGSGKRLRYSINKYGKENHKREIIEFCPDRSSLINRETEIVNLNEIAKEDCMNLRIGGSGGFPIGFDEKIFHIKGGKVSGALRAKKIKEDSEYAQKCKIDMIERIKKARITKRCGYDWTGKKHTDEEKMKIGIKNRLKQKDKKNSQYGTCWITNGIINKKIKKTEFELYLNDWKLGRILNIAL